MCAIVEKYGEDAPLAVVVDAGREPLRFTNLFPFWQTDESAVSDFRICLIISRNDFKRLCVE